LNNYDRSFFSFFNNLKRELRFYFHHHHHHHHHFFFHFTTAASNLFSTSAPKKNWVVFLLLRFCFRFKQRDPMIV